MKMASAAGTGRLDSFCTQVILCAALSEALRAWAERLVSRASGPDAQSVPGAARERDAPQVSAQLRDAPPEPGVLRVSAQLRDAAPEPGVLQDGFRRGSQAPRLSRAVRRRGLLSATSSERGKFLPQILPRLRLFR